MRTHGARNLMIALLTTVATQVAFAQGDTLHLQSGESKQGTIQEWDYRGLKLSVGGGTSTVKNQDVINVDFGGAPKDWKEGVDDAQNGKLADAVAKLQAALDNKKLRAPLRQEAHWWKAQALAGDQKFDEAVAALKAMLEEFPTTHRLEDVHAAMAEYLVKGGKGADAITFVDGEESRVNKLPESGSILEGLKLIRARALLDSGQGAKAKAEAQALASTTGPRASEAKVLMGLISLKADNNPTEAEKQFRDALKVVTKPSLRAACYNGIGEVLQKRGKESNKPDLIREALLNYLRTALQFPPTPGESTGAHEDGLYNAALCFKYLGDLSQDKDVAKRNNGRAAELFRRFVNDYPQSKYKADAAANLQKLGG